ncbi:MAG: HCV capsid domain containing protein [Burkholderiales bacterium]
MAISLNQVESLAGVLNVLPGGANPVPAVRASFPDLAVVHCDAEDMRDETPFCRVGDFDVFLVDTGNHCWRIIDEPAAATGFIIAPSN